MVTYNRQQTEEGQLVDDFFGAFVFIRGRTTICVPLAVNWLSPASRQQGMAKAHTRVRHPTHSRCIYDAVRIRSLGQSKPSVTIGHRTIYFLHELDALRI